MYKGVVFYSSARDDHKEPTMSTSTLTATYTPATDLKVGMFISLGEIVAIRTTAKRVYTTVKLASGGTFEDNTPKVTNVVVLNRASTNGPEIAAAMLKAAGLAL